MEKKEYTCVLLFVQNVLCFLCKLIVQEIQNTRYMISNLLKNTRFICVENTKH